ncbi:hypothetical protein DSM03_1011221 [Leeuwenhoekiella aestuarii]|uniref:Lipoprotein n=1 Tax=Leeuwenhoekiella aestuarii TaxID=2249426 RepID=A0A4Q0NZV9_9FLAO|nr:hypothetical protein [Leeuwenhoekiella aestuarii]RXG18530.1 hypothetical protein DSM04_101732 [Leeuwenhoekiella aestuarii]RXG19835.1 hypothetical protein DSM03_1011221 [Leeuwenhoekiella aestuarii]
MIRKYPIFLILGIIIFSCAEQPKRQIVDYKIENIITVVYLDITKEFKSPPPPPKPLNSKNLKINTEPHLPQSERKKYKAGKSRNFAINKKVQNTNLKKFKEFDSQFIQDFDSNRLKKGVMINLELIDRVPTDHHFYFNQTLFDENKNFYWETKATNGILTFSDFVVNTKANKAIITCGFSQGKLDGVGIRYYLRKENGVWIIDDKKAIAIS